MFSSVYCNESSAHHMVTPGDIKFVIFTSYSDAAGINAALKAGEPWLPCRMARRESIFMVSIDGDVREHKTINVLHCLPKKMLMTLNVDISIGLSPGTGSTMD
ncbi:unnamed protein product [Anisakis simplex]|uniref:DUF1907 domain-containing protein n=1 Tax=Anisakis simplex TaxID=6269 RepID=A0A0M3JD77_ANISI|nr:unnamed protein product [Anisakis simplex]